MARRRRGFRPVASAAPSTAKPKKVYAMKIKKPKVSDLKKILQSYVSVSEADRLNALAKACLWYEDGSATGALAFVLTNKLFPNGEPEFKKSMDTAEKCRQRATGTTFAAEKDTSLRMAIKLYEKCCAKLSVPTLQEYLDQYDLQKTALEAKAQNLQDRFGESLVAVGKALGLPLQVTFCAQCKQYFPQSQVNGCVASHPDQLTPISATIEKLTVTNSNVAKSINIAEKSLMYNRDSALLLNQTVRKEGVLVALLRELPHVVKYSSVQKSADGKNWVSNRDAHLAFHYQAMANLEQWLKGSESPNRLVRKGAGVVSIPIGTAPRPTGRVGFGGRQKLAPGQLFPSNTNNDRVYQVLKDGNPHTLKEVEAAMPVPSSAKGVLKYLAANAPARWNFRIEQNGSDYKLIQGGA